jgi:RNA polymerase sigma-70 factor (ECF subfamily)
VSVDARRRAFEALVVPHVARLHAAALHLSRDPADASDAGDIVQETLLRAFRTFDNFVPGTNAGAWLHTILRSVRANRRRKRGREPRLVVVDDIDQQPSRQAPAPPGAASSVVEREVVSALERLPREHRRVVLLVDVEGLSYEAAAAEIGCPVGTVRSRLFRARKALFVGLWAYARRTGYVRGR